MYRKTNHKCAGKVQFLYWKRKKMKLSWKIELFSSYFQEEIRCNSGKCFNEQGKKCHEEFFSVFSFSFSYNLLKVPRVNQFHWDEKLFEFSVHLKFEFWDFIAFIFTIPRFQWNSCFPSDRKKRLLLTANFIKWGSETIQPLFLELFSLLKW